MTFKEFLEKTGELLKKNEVWITETYFDPKSHDKKQKEAWQTFRGTQDCTFSTSWSLGGTRGNYVDSELESVSAELEPEDPNELDLILEGLCPTLSFMQYKGITREVMKRGEYEDGDWYGGSVTEGYKGFNIKDLYEALNKRGLL